MTTRHSRLLWLDGREPSIPAILDPSSAQFQLWLAQAQRDQGNLSGREMEKMGLAAQSMARRSPVMFNRFTGEVRRLEFLHGELFPRDAHYRHPHDDS